MCDCGDAAGDTEPMQSASVDGQIRAACLVRMRRGVIAGVGI